MRVRTILVLAAGTALSALSWSALAIADGGNPHGYGIYSPVEIKVRGRPRLYSYDPRSWYYRQPRYYPYYGSGYWVPRAEMRYRYRYKYIGPRFEYFPAWGYGGCPTVSRCH
jgi:hypothetical protein